jgi:hypothetical protein
MHDAMIMHKEKRTNKNLIGVYPGPLQGIPVGGGRRGGGRGEGIRGLGAVVRTRERKGKKSVG